VVSMDMKLPSATGQPARWDEHRRFLEAAAGSELFVKAVVTGNTTPDDILLAARLVAGHDASLPFILQPASGSFAPAPDSLLLFQAIALEVLANVRVIPQVHYLLRVP